MKTTIIAIAMLMGGAAAAQTTPAQTTDDSFNAATWTTGPGPVIQASNMNPERDARGIPVISDPAVVPAGWNGSPGLAVGGPLVDASGAEVMQPADEMYPPCTAQVTDNCVQTYTKRF